MKKLVPYITTYGIMIACGVFVLITWLWEIDAGAQITANFVDFSVEMLTFLPFLFLLIGLFDVWVPKALIQRHIGEDSGLKGTVMVVLFAMLQGGPLYGAFPVAGMLWKKGCSLRNIFIYLGAFATLKIPMLTFEIGFLGLKFSVLRTLITLPVFLLIAEIMARYLRNKPFEIKDVDASKA